MTNCATSRAARALNTDDLTLLEYHAPSALLVQGLQDQNHAAILRAQRGHLCPRIGPPISATTI